jgi:hypothetical protein
MCLNRCPKVDKNASYLSSCVNNLRSIVLAFVLYDTAESILNGRVITLHKVSIDKLDRERRFS